VSAPPREREKADLKEFLLGGSTTFAVKIECITATKILAPPMLYDTLSPMHLPVILMKITVITVKYYCGVIFLFPTSIN